MHPAHCVLATDTPEILIGDAGADKLAPELGKIEGLTGLYLSRKCATIDCTLRQQRRVDLVFWTVDEYVEQPHGWP